MHLSRRSNLERENWEGDWPTRGSRESRPLAPSRIMSSELGTNKDDIQPCSCFQSHGSSVDQNGSSVPRPCVLRLRVLGIALVLVAYIPSLRKIGIPFSHQSVVTGM